MDDKTLNEMIANGELGVMTECAYGAPIADTETENNLKNLKKIKKDNRKFKSIKVNE